jgi:hypothetical protein
MVVKERKMTMSKLVIKFSESEEIEIAIGDKQDKDQQKKSGFFGSLMCCCGPSQDIV